MANEVLIFKGMSILPKDLILTIDDLGAINLNMNLYTAYNVIPIWLKIAYDNLVKAKIANSNFTQAKELVSEKTEVEWSEDVEQQNILLFAKLSPEEQKALLVAELTPSMQVIVSCGIALDALNSMLRPYVKELERNDDQKNKKNKSQQTKRKDKAQHIVSSIRQIYNLNEDIMEEFNSSITGIMDFRDKAVHPKLTPQEPYYRPDLSINVAWQFSAFRYSNASTCLINTLIVLRHLYSNKCNNDSINDQINNVILELQEIGLITINS